MDPLISNPGASRWIVTTPSPGLIRNRINNAYKQQLLGEAESMLPNEEELTQTLLNYKVPQGDMAPVYNAVRGQVGEYLQEYRKNPFHAFTREGRNSVRQLQGIVHNPKWKEIEKNYEQLTNNYEKIKDTESATNLNVQNGLVTVLDRQNSSMKKISFRDFNPERYVPLTFEQEYSVKNSRGIADDPDLMTPQIVKLADTNERIRSAFTNLGKQQTDQITDLLKTARSSNWSQIQSRLSALTNGGLSESDMNTLISDFQTKKYKSDGKLADWPEVGNWLNGYLTKVAAGYEETSTGYSKSPLFEAQKDKNDLEGQASLDPWTATLSGVFKQTSPPSAMTYGSGGNAITFERWLAPREGFKADESDARYIKNGEVSTKVLPLNLGTIKAFKEKGFDLQNAFLLGNNGMQQMDLSPIAESLVPDFRSVKNPPSIVKWYVDNNNNPATPDDMNLLNSLVQKKQIQTIPTKHPQLTRYFDQNGSLRFKPFLSIQAMFPGKTGLFASQLNEHEASYRDSFRDAGYDEAEATSNDTKDYNQNSTGFQTNQGVTSYNDNLMRPVFLFPANPAALRSSTGSSVYMEREDAHIQNMNRTPGATLFNPADFLTGKSQIPDIFKGSTLDALYGGNPQQ